MRAARPVPLPHPDRGTHGAVRVHRGLVQPPSPPLRPRLSVANQLRKESLLRRVNRKPSAVHSTGVTPLFTLSPVRTLSFERPRPKQELHKRPQRRKQAFVG